MAKTIKEDLDAIGVDVKDAAARIKDAVTIALQESGLPLAAKAIENVAARVHSALYGVAAPLDLTASEEVQQTE
jgi:hypothetical protein